MKKLKKIIVENVFILFLIIFSLYFSSPFLVKNLLPIPSDTIVGLYHPFRDLYADEYPRGIPFKNFLITDPVRQIYPWKTLSIDILKTGQLPIWNPYEMAGKPLFANFQSSPFYPLNILFFVFPYGYAWSILILLQPVLAGIFLYLYLVHMKINRPAAVLGALAFAFSGFSVAWMEWGTITQTALWIPLILLSIDKAFHFGSSDNLKFKVQNLKLKFKIKNLLWFSVLVLALSASLFAGHLQTFFNGYALSFAYFFARRWQFGKRKNSFILFIILNSLFLTLTFLQWYPTFQFIQESARSVDQIGRAKEGWFIPWHHLVQFVAPDFFGNPTTLNYWGTWNYAELVGYVGIAPLLFAMFALFFRRDKKTLFFGSLVLASLIFAFPTPMATLPYILNIPFLSSAQPTRLLFVTDFSLAILAALGFDYFIKTHQKKQIFFILGIFALLYIALWFFVLTRTFDIGVEDLETAKRNLILPTGLFGVVAFSIMSSLFLKFKKTVLILSGILIVVSAIDVVRFAQKFESFTPSEYLFPNTRIIEYLKKDPAIFRVASDDSRILPPNFLTHYKIQSVEGYDPLYLLSYGEFITASERGNSDIAPPFGFNRIVTPHNISSPFIDLLNVKYVLSFSDLNPQRFELVIHEGITKLYKNKMAFPRVFFVDNVRFLNDKEKILETMFSLDLRKNAVVWGSSIEQKFSQLTVGQAEITDYTENEVRIHTKNEGDGFLVFSDGFYPSWHATINEPQELKIFKTNYTFRGVFVPKGDHDIVFKARLF